MYLLTNYQLSPFVLADKQLSSVNLTVICCEFGCQATDTSHLYLNKTEFNLLFPFPFCKEKKITTHTPIMQSQNMFETNKKNERTFTKQN